MKIAAVLILAGLVTAGASVAPAQAQQCPVGSFPAVDNWGNQICRRASDNSTATTQVPRGQTCPNGAFPAVDNWGNQVCRSPGGPNQRATDSYDTSKGCPIGTIPWTDTWGNRVCKKM